LKVPYYILYPLILLFCVVGVYTVNNNEVEIYILLLSGFLGYVFRKFKFDLAAFIIALVLGPMLEDRFRQSLVLSGGKFSIFFTSPLSLLCWSVVIILLFRGVFPVIRKKVIKKDL
jgi:putative tricarboxylic transport membrane protein